MNPCSRTIRWCLLLAFLPLLINLSGCALIENATTTRVTVEWATGSEVNTAGFNLYRSESPEGSYIKINENLIPASNAISGGKYRFEDTNVIPGRTYHYQLEEVELTGKTTRYDSISVTASGSEANVLAIAILLSMVALTAAYFAVKRVGSAHNSIRTG